VFDFFFLLFNYVRLKDKLLLQKQLYALYEQLNPIYIQCYYFKLKTEKNIV
jgi:hypothetical protein